MSLLECTKGAMSTGQARAMRNRDDKKCQECRICCGGFPSSQDVSKVSKGECHLTGTCNDPSNCPARPSRRIVRVDSQKKRPAPLSV